MNGLMKETANVRMMRAIPFSDEEFYRGLMASDKRLCRYGIASVHEVGVSPHHLRLYTTNAAYAAFEEGIKGGIEPGKRADLAVLSASILNTRPENTKYREYSLVFAPCRAGA